MCSDCSVDPDASVRHRRREVGLCRECGTNTVSRGRLHCQPCLDAANARHHDNLAKCAAAGICCHCKVRAPLPGHSACASCRDRENKQHLARYHRRTAIVSRGVV